MNDQILIYVVGLLAALSVLAFVTLLMVNRNRSQATARAKLAAAQKRNARNYLYFLYRIFMATPLLRRYFIKMKNNFRAIVPADEVTLNKLTTKRMSLCVGAGLGILLLVLLVAKGDVPYMCVGLVAAYIIVTNLINTSEQSMQKKVLDQLDTLISDVHAYYEDSKMVDEALGDTLDDLPYEIGLHANRIHELISQPDVDLAIEQYIDTAPNRFLLLFATICATIVEHGDKILKNGRSLFIQNLDYLKSELGNERIRLQKRTIAFGGKTFSVLIPLFCLKPVQMWAEHFMPEITGFYQGWGGIISLVVVMAVTLICYEFINILKDDHSEEGKSDRFYQKIANFPPVRHYITLWVNHNYSKSERLSDRLKSVGDHSGIDVYIVKKFLVAIVLFVIANATFLYAVHSEKQHYFKDFSDAYTTSLVPDEEFRENMRIISAMHAWEIRHGYTDEEFLQVIGGDMDPAYRELIAQELARRAQGYKNTYYRWYLLLIAIAVSGVGFFIPDMLLRYKVRIMGMAREDEVSQFRTLILILMHEDGMRLDMVLEWMERFARTFKSSITECIFNLERDEQAALETMRDKESGFAPFRRLCDNLMAVDKVGMESAFESLEIDRQYYQEKRKEDNNLLLSRCSSTATTLQFIPVWAVIILYLILPIGIYAMNMYRELEL